MKMLVISFVLAQFCCWAVCSSATAPRAKIHFGAFISNVMKDDLCFKAAIDAAVQLINEDQTILKDFELKMEYLDNYGMSGFGISEFFKIREMPNVIQLLLGPFTEKYAEPIRELSKGMKLPMFEDNGETHQSQRKAMVSLLKKYNWKRTSVLYDFGYIHYVKNAKLLKKALANESIQANIQGFSSRPYFDVKDQMSNIKKEDGRITILDLDNYAAPTLFCDAYLQNMTFPRNIFIGGNINDLKNGWHEQMTYSHTRRCTAQQIQKAAEGFIFLKRSDFQLNDGPHRAKKSRDEIWRLIKSYKAKSWFSYVEKNKRWRNGGSKEWQKVKYNKGSARAFDLVYRAALAFDGLIKKHGADKVLMTQYNDSRKYKQISDAIKAVEFDGVSGKQRHMDLGHELDHVIHQYRNGSFVEIGYYTPSTDEIKLKKGKNLFPAGHVPRDGVLIKMVVLTFKTSILYTMWTAAITGIIFSFSLLFLNWQYRKKRVIKMSSPKVNNIIILGCISCYVSIILYGIDTRFVNDHIASTLCNATIGTLSIGFTLSFGGLFSKTWRIYRIFAAARTNRKVAVRDIQLYVMIMILVSIDVCILSSFISLNPFQLETTNISQNVNYADDVIEVSTRRQCSCHDYMSFLMTLIAYKVVLLAFGLFMAWETRNVHIPVLNDSRHIGIAVYVVALVSTVGAISATALSSTSHVEESYLVVGLSICLCTTVTLMLVFFNKISLIFDKTGRDRTHSTSSIISSSSSYHDPMLSRGPLVNGDNRNMAATSSSANKNRLSNGDKKKETKQHAMSLLSSTEPYPV